MIIIKHSTTNLLPAGNLAYIIYHSFRAGLTALLCRMESITDNGQVVCEGLKVVDENGSPCTFSHNDENIMLTINRAGKRFIVDQSILHPCNPIKSKV